MSSPECLIRGPASADADANERHETYRFGRARQPEKKGRTIVLLAVAQELLVEVLVLLALLGDLLRHLLEQVHDPADRVLAQVLAASQDSCGYLS